MGYELILLDADGTLFDYDAAETTALAKTFDHVGLEYDEHWLRRYRDVNEALWRNLEAGKTTSAEIRVERFRQLLAVDAPGATDAGGGAGTQRSGATGKCSHAYRDIDVEEMSRAYLRFLSEGSQLIDGAEEICRRLAGKYRLAILTNGIRSVQLPRFERSSVSRYIEKMIISEDAGYNKPHPGVFDYAFRVMGHRDRTTCMIIGDSLTSDIRGGVNYGIATCWYNPDARPSEPDLAPDHEIRDLRELMQIL